MKRRNLLAIMLMVTMGMAGCGEAATADTKEAGQTAAESVSKEAENTANAAESNASDGKSDFVTAEEIDSLITEKDKEELDLKEYFYSYEDRNVEKEGEPVFYLANFEMTGDYFYLTDSVDIYAYNGICIGYTKPDIEITPIGRCDNWYYFDLRGNTRFAKVSDVEAAGFAGSKQDYLASIASKEEAPSTQTQVPNNVPSEPVEVQPEAPAPVQEVPAEPAASESDKYSPEEAIAVYRSLMEEGGITWNPSLKDVTSWGTGWIYLEKGQPEWCASTDLESFAMGDSAGNPWTEYYLEVTGSDEGAVYITAWHN